MNWLAAALISAICVEFIVRLPIGATLARINRTAGKSFNVLRSPAISDHWKEKAARSYSGVLLGQVLRLAALFAAVAALLLGLLWLVERWLPGFTGFLLGIRGILASTVFACIYYFLRKRFVAA